MASVWSLPTVLAQLIAEYDPGPAYLWAMKNGPDLQPCKADAMRTTIEASPSSDGKRSTPENWEAWADDPKDGPVPGPLPSHDGDPQGRFADPKDAWRRWLVIREWSVVEQHTTMTLKSARPCFKMEIPVDSQPEDNWFIDGDHYRGMLLVDGWPAVICIEFLLRQSTFRQVCKSANPADFKLLSDVTSRMPTDAAELSSRSKDRRVFGFSEFVHDSDPNDVFPLGWMFMSHKDLRRRKSMWRHTLHGLMVRLPVRADAPDAPVTTRFLCNQPWADWFRI